MTPAIRGTAARAVDRLLDRMATLAATDLPGVTATRLGDALRLVGPRLRWRRVTDAALRGLAHAAVRGGP